MSEYARLMEQVTIEFSIENLLFITIMLQIQDYLIDNNIWLWKIISNININPNCQSVTNMIGKGDRIHLPKGIIPISPIVSKMSKQKEIKHNNNNNYDMFIDCFIQLYKEYIEQDKAPFEVNISFENRHQMKILFHQLQSIKTNIIIDTDIKDVENQERHGHFDGLDRQEFVKLWKGLNFVCDELLELLIFTLIRCQNKMKI